MCSPRSAEFAECAEDQSVATACDVSLLAEVGEVVGEVVDVVGRSSACSWLGHGSDRR